MCRGEVGHVRHGAPVRFADRDEIDRMVEAAKQDDYA